MRNSKMRNSVMRNSKSRKLLVLWLALSLILAMTAGCGNGDGTEADNGDKDANVPETVSEIVKVATLNGPTGMGMVQLMDMSDKYEVTAYQSPTDIAPKVISGEVDVAALPSNMAAVLYQKTEGQVVALSPIALGVLHILGNDVQIDKVADLAGKTIVASGQGGAPEYILQKVLEAAGLTIYEDVEVTWLANHSEVNTLLLSQPGTIAMVPEPFVSTALASGKGGVSEIFDMNALWSEATGQELPMGVLVARKSFVEEKGDDLKVLLNDLQASVDFVNGNPAEAAQLIVEKGFMGKAEIAEAAIPNCHIVLYAGEKAAEGAEMLKTFNQTLFDMEPASVGGKVPDDGLYYVGAK